MARPARPLANLVDAARGRAAVFGTEIDLSSPEGADATVAVYGVVDDSRCVDDGVLYCAVVGGRHDGHDYVGDAERRGASAVLVERDVSATVPEVRTNDVRQAMPWLASEYWGNPSDRIATIGVTGTNGKTTITSLLGHIATIDGRGGTVIGTLTGALTTPEAPALQAGLANAVEESHRLAAIEVSSHALDQHRADGINFAVGIFTNLTTDHLDYHETMDDYFAAKAKLFDGRSRTHIIVIADDWGRRLAEMTPEAVLIDPETIAIESLRADGSTFLWRHHRVEVPLVGDFNVINAVCAAEAARAVGIDESVIVGALGTMPPVKGRMDRVSGLPPGSPTVYVDYSHTPDGLYHALRALRSITSGRLICVFGAGGDRDAIKRPLMGRTAEHGSDITIVTSDNPRSEDPKVIVEHVISGMSSRSAAIVELDRGEAIRRALVEAAPDDVVLVAGKGHEAVQVVKEEKVAFDDAVVVYEHAHDLAEKREGGN